MRFPNIKRVHAAYLLRFKKMLDNLDKWLYRLSVVVFKKAENEYFFVGDADNKETLNYKNVIENVKKIIIKKNCGNST